MPRETRESARSRPQPVRITTASASREADIRARQKRYLFSMSLRSACFVGAIIVFITTGPGIFVWVLVAGALVLPYIAVVMANATMTKADGFALVEGGQGRPQLGQSTAPRDREA